MDMRKKQTAKFENNYRRKLILVVLTAMIITWVTMGIVIFSPMSSGLEESIGDNFAINQTVNLIQNCDCTHVIFTRVLNPSNVVIVQNALAEQNGTAFNFTLDASLIDEFGEYIVTGEGNLSTGIQTFSYTFEVSKGQGIFGLDLTSPIGILAVLIGVVLLIGLMMSKQFLIMGGIVSITGFILFINGIIWFVSIPIIMIGVAIVIVRKDK